MDVSLLCSVVHMVEKEKEYPVLQITVLEVCALEWQGEWSHVSGMQIRQGDCGRLHLNVKLLSSPHCRPSSAADCGNDY